MKLGFKLSYWSSSQEKRWDRSKEKVPAALWGGTVRASSSAKEVLALTRRERAASGSRECCRGSADPACYGHLFKYPLLCSRVSGFPSESPDLRIPDLPWLSVEMSPELYKSTTRALLFVAQLCLLSHCSSLEATGVALGFSHCVFNCY